MTATVWIVDDDKAIRWVLEKALSRAGVNWRSFASADDAWAALESGDAPTAVLSDIRMPGLDGLTFLNRLRERLPQVAVVIMTAHADLNSAVTSFQSGAFEYLPKPFDIEQAVQLTQRALVQNSNPLIETSAPAQQVDLPALYGQAPAMQDLFRAIGRLSQSLATVLITGETGSGKERVAEALHRHSPRRDGPFIALNTAAIPRDLLESELFGHEKGAFTGAQALRRGRFAEAAGGTLFLDEIGDMPLELQTRLLRVLSDGSYYRVGGHTPQQAEVRIIAATHQPLEERVCQGLFREDLFHRLNVIRLRLPPLRERREDIPLLAERFLVQASASLRVETKHLSVAALACLDTYDFPGNVRELENLCQWLTVMAPAQTVEYHDLPEELRAAKPSDNADSRDWAQALAAELRRRLTAGESGMARELAQKLDRICLQVALEHTGGRKMEAAQRLGWGRNTLTRKWQELGEEGDEDSAGCTKDR